MKKILFNLFCGVFLVLSITSCEKDNEGTTYTLNADEPTGLSLLWSTGTLTYKPYSVEASIPVVRRNTSGALTVPVIATYDATAFSIPTSVTFEDGQNQALLKFSLANAELSKSYTINVALDIDSSKLVTYGIYNTGGTPATKPMTYGIRKAKITLLKDYDWVTLGEGVFNSTWFVEEGRKVQMQKADGYDGVYRAVNIYTNNGSMVIRVNGTTATVDRQMVGLDSNRPLYAEGSGTFIDGVITLTLDFNMYTTAGALYYSEPGDVEVIILPK